MSVEFGHADPEARFHTARGAEADPPGWSTAFIGAVSVIILIVTLLGLEALFRYQQGREDQFKLHAARHVDRAVLQQSQRETIASYKRDKQTGVVQIPIEQAKELVLKDLKAGAGS